MVAERVTQRNTHQARTENKTVCDKKRRQQINKPKAVHQALFSSSKGESLSLISETMKINLGYTMGQ
jgi:hypothetical protein